MYALATVALEVEPELPMEIAGWGVLGLSILITALWLAYVYR
ncbi:hypothetical protein [Halovivax gelatinilyticus]|nr:hypothetical protein [Halovivax gelatinilyticus]